MNKRKMLAQQRRVILAQSAVQREVIASQARVLMRTVSWVDKGWTLIKVVRKPALVASFILSLVTLKSQGVSPLLSKSFMLWQTARSLFPTIREIITRLRS